MNMPLPGLGAPPQMKSMLRAESCGKCKWHAAVAGQPHIECRRYPPVPNVIATNRGMQTVCNFPILTPEYWCGEWKPGIEGMN
jgi:hypothetical protein